MQSILASVWGTRRRWIKQILIRAFQVSSIIKGCFWFARSLPNQRCGPTAHSYRVYLQIQAWRGNNLPLVNWGWKKEQHSFVPVYSSDPSAPDTLLKNIFCLCIKGCGNGCSCRKLGIKFMKFIFYINESHFTEISFIISFFSLLGLKCFT